MNVQVKQKMDGDEQQIQLEVKKWAKEYDLAESDVLGELNIDGDHGEFYTKISCYNNVIHLLYK